MHLFKNLSFDEIIIEIDSLELFLKRLNQHHLKIFHFKHLKDNQYIFYVPYFQHFTTKKLNLPISRTIGLFYYLFKSILFPYNITTLSFCLTLYFSNQMIWYYKIEGNVPSINQELQTIMKDTIASKKNYQYYNELFDIIKDKQRNNIDYLNIYQNGGILHVRYTPQVHETIKKPHFYNYIASKDGVICFIDVLKGRVVVEENQYVEKGQLLISSTIESVNENKIIETDGKIYAYTYYQLEASCLKNKNEGFAYLLFKIRNKLPKNVKIDKEKLISYDIIGNKLFLKMQYVCVENIAIEEK